MKSATAVSYELDNVQTAAQELSGQIAEKLTLQAHSIGLLFCDADLDGAALTAELNELLGIEVGGMATFATLDASGYHEGALVLLVLTADDIQFAAAVSEPFSEDYTQQIVRTYESLVPQNPPDSEHPSLLLAFCPSSTSFSVDVFPDVLAQVSNSTPIIGGVTSDDYDYERARLFLNGEEYHESLVLIALWGALKPVFSLRHVTSEFAERIRRVTESQDNVVFKMGDENFVEYLKGFGLDVEVEDPTLSFVTFPLLLTYDEGDDTPILRHIASLDLEAGTGTFLGNVPEDTLANICLISREDLKVSARESIEVLLQKMAEEHEYTYSTVLCISCCGRGIILGRDSDAEGTILSSMLPQNLALGGAYCLGEICPTHYEDGQAINRFHNCSFTLCAF